MNLKRFFEVLVVFVLVSPLNSVAGEAKNLDGPVILSISNANSQDGSSKSSGSALYFDRESLEAFGLVSVKTETPWTKGLVHFEGVLVREVLASTEMTGTKVMAKALDDYSVEIPISDFVDNDVILATRKNGKPLSVRDNGPVWIIYPWSDIKELRRPHFYARSIWQLKSIKLQ